MNKALLFALDQDDFDLERFRPLSPGMAPSQDTGVRVRHAASGSVGECCEAHSQNQNLQIAFRRCTEHAVFLTWIRPEVIRRRGEQAIEELLHKHLMPVTITVQVLEDGLWIPELGGTTTVAYQEGT